MKQFLLDLLHARLSPAGWEWLNKALGSMEGADYGEALLPAYAGASRRVGKVSLELNSDEAARAVSLDPHLPLDHWGADEAARVVLLLSLSHLERGAYASSVLKCYGKGDSREQASWLRGLSLLSGPEEFLDCAMDSCRTNIIPLFEAIACENPYPWRYFPELNFNQMVLKGLFNGIAISRIMGLEQRLNADLSVMSNDYASEREAAGRPVPPDIWMVVAPQAAAPALERVRRYLGHENAEHRYWAAAGFGHSPTDESREALRAQRKNERERRVLERIDKSLAAIA